MLCARLNSSKNGLTVQIQRTGMTIQWCLSRFGDHQIFVEMLDGKPKRWDLIEEVCSIYELIILENEK